MKKENRQKAIELAKKAEDHDKTKKAIEKALKYVEIEPVTIVKWSGLYVPIESKVLEAQLKKQRTSTKSALTAVENELDKL